ncbi:MAG: anaerobic ribonucleoside-triphosphate reductase [Spirochaetales bacterium]
MKNLHEIDAELATLRAQLASVQGRECEVYTRIVGYYRSLRNWNKGKKEEYRQRITFSSPHAEQERGQQSNPSLPESLKLESAELKQISLEEKAPTPIAAYRYFFRKTCPKCPPVKEYVARLGLSGKHVDVDTEEGFSEAQAFQVLSTPTVIFFDSEGRPIHEAHSLDQLSYLQPWLEIQPNP